MLNYFYIIFGKVMIMKQIIEYIQKNTIHFA